jgi:hypothetical protein
MDAARGVCVAAWQMDFRLPLGSAVRRRFIRRAVNRLFNDAVDVGRAEVHGQLHASAQHFLDVPMPRHLIGASACDDNVAFHVLDSDLVSVYDVVRSEKGSGHGRSIVEA